MSTETASIATAGPYQFLLAHRNEFFNSIPRQDHRNIADESYMWGQLAGMDELLAIVATEYGQG